MADRTILEYPDARLRAAASPVECFDADLRALVGDLVDTLHAKCALGLCAPQLGAPLQVLAIDLSEDQSEPQVFINPEVISATAWGLVEESCLSVPDVVTNVWRATQILVRARDVDGEPFERHLKMMEAVCVQHEIDHFSGKLLVDRLWFWQRWRLGSRSEAHA